MKKYVFLAAGVMITASSAALAQNHGAGTQSNVTVGGIFVPAVSSTGTFTGGSAGNVTVTTPPTTPVTVRAFGEAASVVSGGGATAVASLTVALQGNGRSGPGGNAISPTSATALANALALLSSGGTPTVQSVVNAVTAWNLAVAAMSPADVRGAYFNGAFLNAQRALAGAVQTIAPNRPF